VKPIAKSSKLANVCYDIRGPVLDKARQMEDEGHKIIKLNIGNIAAFGLEPPDEIVQDMIRNLPHTAGYTDSKGLFAPRRAVVHYTQEKQIRGVTVDDVYLGNGASELIVMSLNALLDDGDQVLLPSPDYPLYTAAVALSGGTPVHYVCDEQSGWLPDIDDIKKKITPHTASTSWSCSPTRSTTRRSTTAPRTPASPRWPTTCCSSPTTACRRTTAPAATAPAGWWCPARSGMPGTTSRG
jgi:alanine-synthesizing transaminase